MHLRSLRQPSVSGVSLPPEYLPVSAPASCLAVWLELLGDQLRSSGSAESCRLKMYGSTPRKPSRSFSAAAGDPLESGIGVHVAFPPPVVQKDSCCDP